MKNTSQAEQVYEYVRKKLLSGQYDPGQRLIEQSISKAAGGNRGDARQAFSRLLAEGLVEKGDKGGVFVRVFTQEDYLETQEVRQIIEFAAVKLASERAEEEDFQDLEQTARHMVLMAKNDYHLGVSEADLRFHELLVKAAHNSRLLSLYKRANIPLTGIQFLLQEREAHRDELLPDADDHLAIVHLIRKGETDKAIGLLKKSENK